jgi:transketolase
VKTVDGHDLPALEEALTARPEPGKPTAIIARTTKGRGVSFMEGVVRWHHGVPTDDEYTRAVAEIDAGIAALSGHA